MRSVCTLSLLFAATLGAKSLPAQFTGFWESRTSLQNARQEVGVAVAGGRVYCAGGLFGFSALSTVECYDPATGQWSYVASMPTVRHHFGMATLGGLVYVVGGYDSSGFSPDERVYSYDPQTDRWTPRASLPVARGALAAVAIGGRIYAVGGVRTGNVISGDLTAYDPSTNQWTTLRPMGVAREHLAAAALDGKLYVAGGRRGGNVNAMEVYDPATDQWTTLAPLPTARSGNGAAALDGKIVVFGGEGPRMFPEVEEYDPQTNQWRRLRDMTTALHGIYPVVLGDEVMIAGGADVVGFGAVNLVLAFRNLPTGVERYGASTPACNGPIAGSVDRAPTAGDAQFAVVSSPNGPPGAAGGLLLGGARIDGGVPVLGADLHVGPPPFFLLGTTADGQGAGRVALPLPAGLQGTFYVQFVWLGTQTCGNPSSLSASDALCVTVQ